MSVELDAFLLSPVVPAGRTNVAPPFRVASNQSPSMSFDSPTWVDREIEPLSQPRPKNDDESRKPQW